MCSPWLSYNIFRIVCFFFSIHESSQFETSLCNYCVKINQEVRLKINICFNFLIPSLLGASLKLFCCNAALRTTRGCPYVRYSKNLQATHTSKFVILSNIFLRMPLWNFFLENLVYEGVQYFLDTKCKIIFLL